MFYSNFDSGQPAGLSGAGGHESVGGFAGAGNTGDTFTGDLWRDDGWSATILILNILNFYASGGGYQGGGDESWAFDHYDFVVKNVPAPGTVGALSIFGLAALRRRR